MHGTNNIKLRPTYNHASLHGITVFTVYILVCSTKMDLIDVYYNAVTKRLLTFRLGDTM